MKVFIDTNILTYAFDKDAGNKYAQTKEIIKNCWNNLDKYYLSTQVLQEFQSTLNKLSYSVKDSNRATNHFLSWQIIPVTHTLIKKSLDIRQKWKTSVWDSSIIAAAQQASVKELWSEDFQQGQDFDGVKIVNPLS